MGAGQRGRLIYVGTVLVDRAAGGTKLMAAGSDARTFGDRPDRPALDKELYPP